MSLSLSYVCVYVQRHLLLSGAYYSGYLGPVYVLTFVRKSLSLNTDIGGKNVPRDGLFINRGVMQITSSSLS